MDNQKRRLERKQSNLPVNIVLYNSLDDSIATGPHPAFLHDITYYGAGLFLESTHFPPYHLFYSPLELDNHVLCLEKEKPEGDSLIIPIKPIWFRQGEEETHQFFRMGVEFQTAPEDTDVIELEKMALACFEPNATLLTKLLRIFR